MGRLPSASSLSLTCVASPSPARLEWVLSRSSLLVASPPISSHRLTTPTLAPSDPLARSCSFMQPALSSHRTRTPSLSTLLSLHAHRYRHALVVSTRVGHIKYRASPGEAACTRVPKHGTHGAAQHTRALSSDTSPTVRPTRLRPSSPPTVLARLCSALLGSACLSTRRQLFAWRFAHVTATAATAAMAAAAAAAACLCLLSGVSGVGEG
jgi:hypothetical protein